MSSYARYGRVRRQSRDRTITRVEQSPPNQRHRRPGPSLGARYYPLGAVDSRTATGENESSIIGFAGMWLAFDEAHVTTIGVDPPHRGHGLGELLLLCMFDEAVARGANWLTLEVRVTNAAAQALYRKYGFTAHGTRKRYYSDNNEDALIMWSPALGEPAYRAQVESRREALARRLGHRLAPGSLAPFPGPANRSGATS